MPVLETESFELIRRCVVNENTLGFQIPLGLDSGNEAQIQYRSLPETDVPEEQLYLG